MKPRDMKSAVESVKAVIPFLEDDVAYSPDRIASRCCRFLSHDVKPQHVKGVLDALDHEPVGRNWTGIELKEIEAKGAFDAIRADLEANDDELVESYRRKYLGG